MSQYFEQNPRLRVDFTEKHIDAPFFSDTIKTKRFILFIAEFGFAIIIPDILLRRDGNPFTRNEVNEPPLLLSLT